MDRATFERLVDAAVDDIPDDVFAQLDNVVFCVEDGEQDGESLGEYIGVPRTERGTEISGILPDKIVVYRLPTIAECEGNPNAIREEISRTVWHEIAHHLGWEDDAVEEAERRRGWR